MSGNALLVRREAYAGQPCVAVEWDFSVAGGSFGTQEAATFVAACDEAIDRRLPLVTITRTAGTRLPEGMPALVGIPRAILALDRVGAAGLPHLGIADHPTTGGVWVAIGSQADARAAVRGATIGFAGPRVVEALTGSAVPAGAHTAESAYASGLVDAIIDADDIGAYVGTTLATLAPDDAVVVAPPADPPVPDRRGWHQVEWSRHATRPAGRDLAAALLDDAFELRGTDESVAAFVGRLAGRRAVIVALAADRAGHPGVGGYALLTRAANLASRLDLALLVLVDAAGADPSPSGEQRGIAPAIEATFRAVLHCAAPTIAVVHGEGGSGGALAGAVCDVVGVTEHGWFAALVPEGAAAALRRTPQEAADLMKVAPADLLACGFADTMVPGGREGLRDWLAGTIDRLRDSPPPERLRRRQSRWSSALHDSG